MTSAPVQLSDAESELYDRQIRLWGIESQLRLQSSVFAIVGMDGLGAELVKNLVLAGVGAVIMFDQNETTQEDFKTQFLIPRSSIGQNRAEASVQRARALNPMVKVFAEKKPVLSAITNTDDFPKCNFIISCNQSFKLNLQLNKVAREMGVGFYMCLLSGTFGCAFCDLNKHSCTVELKTLKSKKVYDSNISQKVICYPTFEESLAFDLLSQDFLKIARRTPATIFLAKILFKFQEEFEKWPTENDINKLLDMRDSMLQNYPIILKKLPDEAFRCVTSGILNPVCAIVGAYTAQDAVKATTHKGLPLNNYFLFDPLTLSAHEIEVGTKVVNQ